MASDRWSHIFGNNCILLFAKVLVNLPLLLTCELIYNTYYMSTLQNKVAVGFFFILEIINMCCFNGLQGNRSTTPGAKCATIFRNLAYNINFHLLSPMVFRPKDLYENLA